jgi:hypothetical protein
MKNVYLIEKVDLENNQSKHIWTLIQPIKISHFPWDDNHYRPKTEVKMFYTESHFHVQFKAYEPEIKVSYLKMNDPVYRDSCVEIFLNPNPGRDSRYINFEINPVGSMLVGIGTNREDRTRITSNAFKQCKVRASLTREPLFFYSGESWLVELTIPFSFLEEYYGKLRLIEGREMEGNFYKCGDDTKYPHYGCWNSITCKSPDFHRPECFGKITLK